MKLKFWEKSSPEEILRHQNGAGEEVDENGDVIEIEPEEPLSVCEFEVHFKDGEILKIVAAAWEREDNFMTFEDGDEETFITIMYDNTKYILESAGYELPKNEKCGVFKVKAPKYIPLTKKNRIDTVE